MDVKVHLLGKGVFFVFSQTVEYALRAVVHLASEAPADRMTAQIAEATHVPRAYLSKVLQRLGTAGSCILNEGFGHFDGLQMFEATDADAATSSISRTGKFSSLLSASISLA